MRSRRLVFLAATAAAIFTAAGAFAAPTITPQTLQCDGTFRNGGSTNHPTPSIQALVLDPSGLRIGQAGMGLTNGSTRALWRFDVNVDVTSSCATGNQQVFYSYTDPNNSDTISLGECDYTGCAAGGLAASPQVPLGQASCPPGAPGVGSIGLFGAGQFGDKIAFDAVHYGSVTYNRTGLGDRPATYTLSAWIRSPAAAHPRALQRILSEQGPAGYWGFGLRQTGGLRLFDSRNGSNTDVEVGASFDDGAWHKIDVVRNNATLQERFFADGNFLGFVTISSTDSFVAHPISHPVLVGGCEAGICAAGVAENFLGDVDELRVVDTAISDEEIKLEYLGSNIHKYSPALATSYSTVLGGFPGSVTNGFTTTAVYTPVEAITTATAPNQRWIFEAQNTDSVSTISSTFTVTIDQTAPTAPQSFSGAPNGVNAVTWSWAVPSHFCPPPGSASVFYQLFDAVAGGANLNPPGNMAYPATSVSEAGTANQLLSRRLTLTDRWATSPLTPSASAYTAAAVPTGLTATSVSTGGFVATWNANANPGYTRYELTYTTDPAFLVGISTKVGIVDNFTGTSIAVTGLATGTTYFVRVYSFNGRSTDSFGSVRSAGFASLTAVVTPGPPALAGTTLSASSIRWAWTSATGATGYTLYDSPTQAVLFGPNGAALTFTSATLTANTRYDAEVEAVLPAPSPPSGRGHAFAYTKANPPAAASIYAAYATSATFSWNPNGNPFDTFYEIIVATDPAFGVVTSTLTVSTPTVTATGLLPGVTYYAHVEAISGGQIETGFGPTVSTVTVPDPAITINQSPASPYVAPAGLVGAWQFDENTGTTTADSSGGGNTGNLGCTTASCVSTPTFTAGPVGLGSAVSFTGQAGGVVQTNTGAPFNFATSVTIEAWVNPVTAAQTASAGIAAVGRAGSEDFAIDVSSHESFEFLTTVGGNEIKLAVATATIAAGQWTHVVGVYDSAHSTATLYLNGVPVAVTVAAGARANLHPPLAIGNRQDAAGNFTLPFAGAIDSVRVIAAALTAAQVKTDYNGSFVSSVTPGSPNAGIVVGLPPNAFGAAAQIFISADPVNHPIRISPAELSAGLQVGPPGLTLVPGSLVEVVPVVGGLPFTTPLGSPATLTIPYKDPNNTGLISGTNPPLAAAGLQMYTLNTAVNSWALLPTVVDKSNRSASAQTPHFSLFGLFAPATVGTNLSGVKAFPVPWKPGSGGRFDAPGVSFSNLPAAGTIRILTLGGRRVRDLPFNGNSAGTAVWDGANDDGRRAASGVYFARISSAGDGSSVLVKFAVER